MKILMVTTGVSLMDGINRHIVNVAPELNNREDVEVAVLTEQPWGEFCDVLAKHGVKVYALGCPNGHALRLLPRVCRVMREFKPDIVHVHVLPLMARIALSLFCRRVKLVLTIHSLPEMAEVSCQPQKQKPTFKRLLERCLLKVFTVRFCGVCYISKGVKRFLKGNGPVVYNPIEFGSTKRNGRPSLCAELNLPAGTPLVGTACRIARQKNPQSLARVIGSTLVREPQVHGIVVGTGLSDAVAEMKAIIDGYGVSSRVHWLGYRVDAPELIAQFSFFVMTSYWEGLPTTLLEAMSQKTPIAFLRGKGGLEDLDELNRAEGPIAAVADTVAELTDGIVANLDNPAAMQEMAERAFEVGKRNFDVQAVALKLEKFYCEVMSK